MKMTKLEEVAYNHQIMATLSQAVIKFSRLGDRKKQDVYQHLIDILTQRNYYLNQWIGKEQEVNMVEKKENF